MNLKTILVPLDGSWLAELALPEAVELAARLGARLHLLRAVRAEPIHGSDPVTAQSSAVREAEEYLAEVAGRLTAGGLAGVTTSVWYAKAAWAIVEAARCYGVDLIVMNTHGRSGLGRLVLGSVAESVIRRTTTPVLVIRSATAPVEAPDERDDTGSPKGAISGGSVSVESRLAAVPVQKVTSSDALRAARRDG